MNHPHHVVDTFDPNLLVDDYNNDAFDYNLDDVDISTNQKQQSINNNSSNNNHDDEGVDRLFVWSEDEMKVPQDEFLTQLDQFVDILLMASTTKVKLWINENYQSAMGWAAYMEDVISMVDALPMQRGQEVCKFLNDQLRTILRSKRKHYDRADDEKQSTNNDYDGNNNTDSAVLRFDVETALRDARFALANALLHNPVLPQPILELVLCEYCFGLPTQQQQQQSDSQQQQQQQQQQQPPPDLTEEIKRRRIQDSIKEVIVDRTQFKSLSRNLMNMNEVLWHQYMEHRDHQQHPMGEVVNASSSAADTIAIATPSEAKFINDFVAFCCSSEYITKTSYAHLLKERLKAHYSSLSDSNTVSTTATATATMDVHMNDCDPLFEALSSTIPLGDPMCLEILCLALIPTLYYMGDAFIENNLRLKFNKQQQKQREDDKLWAPDQDPANIRLLQFILANLKTPIPNATAIPTTTTTTTTSSNSNSNSDSGDNQQQQQQQQVCWEDLLFKPRAVAAASQPVHPMILRELSHHYFDFFTAYFSYLLNALLVPTSFSSTTSSSATVEEYNAIKSSIARLMNRSATMRTYISGTIEELINKHNNSNSSINSLSSAALAVLTELLQQ